MNGRREENLGEKYTHDILYDTFMMEQWRISIPASFLTAIKISLMAFTALLSMPASCSTHLSLLYEVERSFISLGQAFFCSKVQFEK